MLKFMNYKLFGGPIKETFFTDLSLMWLPFPWYFHKTFCKIQIPLIFPRFGRRPVHNTSVQNNYYMTPTKLNTVTYFSKTKSLFPGVKL